MGSLPELRPERSSPSRSRSSRYDSAVRRRPTARRCQPRDRGRLSDRLDLQADHRAGRRSSAGVITPDDVDRRPGLHPDRRAASCLQRRAARPTARSTCAEALQVSSDVFFYNLGATLNGRSRGEPLQKWARSARPRAPHRASTCPARSAGTCPTAHGARASARRSARCERRSTRRQLRHRRQAPVDGRATTSTSRSARATCRPRRCRWRSPTRRSPTAAASSRRTSACEIEDAAGTRAAAASTRRAGAPRRRSTRRTAQAILDGLHAAASEPGGTSADVFERLDQAAFPVYGKTGTAERHGPGRPVLVRRATCRDPTQADRGRRHRRAGRLRRRGRRPGGAPDPRRSGSASRRLVARRARRTAMSAADAHPRRRRRAPREPRRARALRAAVRPAAAARGRSACAPARSSTIARRDARTTSPATRTTTSTARRSTSRVGLVLDARRCRASTTRACAS